MCMEIDRRIAKLCCAFRALRRLFFMEKSITVNAKAKVCQAYYKKD